MYIMRNLLVHILRCKIPKHFYHTYEAECNK
jgi:hypothetical protein